MEKFSFALQKLGQIFIDGFSSALLELPLSISLLAGNSWPNFSSLLMHVAAVVPAGRLAGGVLRDAPALLLVLSRIIPGSRDDTLECEGYLSDTHVRVEPSFVLSPEAKLDSSL